MEFWHSSERRLSLMDITIGLHVGSFAQAKMRRPNGIMHKIKVKPSTSMTTMKDHGSWSPSRLRQALRRAPLARYLNRFEGIKVEDLSEAALCADKSDRIFAKRVPSASESWIILDPTIISAIEIHQAQEPKHN